MYSKPGDRVRVENTTEDPIANGAACALGGHVGFIEKNTQIDRWVKPGSEEATHVMPEEWGVLFVIDVHELPLTGGLAGAAVGDKLYIDAETQEVVRDATAGGTDEKQSVKVDGTGGTYRLELDGELTDKLGPALTAAEFKAELEELSNVNPGDIASVAGGPGDAGGTTPYVITLGGDWGNENVPTIEVVEEELTGGGGTVTVTTTTAGAAGGVLPLGVIDEIDTARTPDVALVNLSDLKPFLTA